MLRDDISVCVASPIKQAPEAGGRARGAGETGDTRETQGGHRRNRGRKRIQGDTRETGLTGPTVLIHETEINING